MPALGSRGKLPVEVVSFALPLVADRLARLGYPAEPLRGADGAVFLASAGAGLVLAGTISWVMNTFELISFGPEIASIYFLRAVPFKLTLADAGWIGLFTLGITLISCWLPSRRALTLDPSAALRYE